MRYPSFFDAVEPIVLYDPLSDFLGAFEAGEIKITYLDCVKLAGHSCPTVAGAYLMTKLGLERLFKETLPHRGMVHVSMRQPQSEGVAGVVCNVASYIVGAGDKGGFKGIQGHFSRDNLIDYDMPMEGEMRLTRLDTEESVTLSYDPSVVPGDPEMKTLMGKHLQGVATEEEKRRFGVLWQKRVEKILLSPELWGTMITVK